MVVTLVIATGMKLIRTLSRMADSLSRPSRIWPNMVTRMWMLSRWPGS